MSTLLGYTPSLPMLNVTLQSPPSAPVPYTAHNFATRKPLAKPLAYLCPSSTSSPPHIVSYGRSASPFPAAPHVQPPARRAGCRPLQAPPISAHPLADTRPHHGPPKMKALDVLFQPVPYPPAESTICARSTAHNFAAAKPLCGSKTSRLHVCTALIYLHLYVLCEQPAGPCGTAIFLAFPLMRRGSSGRREAMPPAAAEELSVWTLSPRLGSPKAAAAAAKNMKVAAAAK